MKTLLCHAAAAACLAAFSTAASAQYNHTVGGYPTAGPSWTSGGTYPAMTGARTLYDPGQVGRITAINPAIGYPSVPTQQTFNPYGTYSGQAPRPSQLVQPRLYGGDRSTWSPSGRPQGGPLEIGFGLSQSLGQAVGSQQNGVAGQIAGQLSAGLQGGLTIDPTTGKVRGQLQGAIEGGVLAGVEGPGGGVVRSLTQGLARGISFGN
jgi:hypothetical protein